MIEIEPSINGSIARWGSGEDCAKINFSMNAQCGRRAAFAQQLNDSSVILSVSILYDAGSSNYYLTAIGSKNGEGFGASVLLANSSGNFTISLATSLRLCSGTDNCNCRFTPACSCWPVDQGNKRCTEGGSEAVLYGHLGDFY